MSFNIQGNDGSTAHISEEEWIEVPLKEGQENYLPKLYVYHISPKDYKCIDCMFDPLYKAGKLSPATGYTPSAYLVFIIQKTITNQNSQTKEKRCIVINLHSINKEVILDLYPILI